MSNLFMGDQENQLKYQGEAFETLKLHLLNLLLSILTLGVYSFWGRTRIRQYVASNLSLLDGHFEYTGTGMELLKGFLKAIILLLIFNLLFSLTLSLFASSSILGILLFIILAAIPIFLVNAALFWSLKYRLSRTTWRGIRGRLSGSGLEFAWIKIKRTILNVVTLGLAIPESDIIAHKYKVIHMQYGQVPLSFKQEKPHELQGINIITLLLFFPTFGFSRFWYQATLRRYLDDCTHIGDLELRSTHTGEKLLFLHGINMLIMLFTLGLGIPFVLHRMVKYYTENTFIVGDIEQSLLTNQVASDSDPLAEGVDDLLSDDVGVI